jgi:uncharacterized membrane protein YfcA
VPRDQPAALTLLVAAAHAPPMTALHATLIFLAGLYAGTINVVVGSGSLVTFPTLIALGYPPILANVSNNIGLVPGSLSGVYGYRRELAGQRQRLLGLLPASVAGGAVGAVLLFVLPSTVFKRVVVVLIVIALVLVIAQPRLSARLSRRRSRRHGALFLGSIFLVGVYGGYFGAAQGIILIGLLAIFVADELQRLNAAKNVLALAVNGVASVVFVIATRIDWKVAGLIALGSSLGGVVGASFGRRLNPTALRVVIIAVGTVAIVRLV